LFGRRKLGGCAAETVLCVRWRVCGSNAGDRRKGERNYCKGRSVEY
jgi:hypothetical protein